MINNSTLRKSIRTIAANHQDFAVGFSDVLGAEECYDFVLNTDCLATQVAAITRKSTISIRQKNMNDEQWRQLIEDICGNPDPNSPDRRKSINRLLIELNKLPQIWKSSHLLYDDALDRTWLYVSRNICTFTAAAHQSIQHMLVCRINNYLRWRIHDLYSNQQGQSCREYSLDTPIDDDNLTSLLDRLSETGFTPPKLSGLDAYLEERKNEQICRIWQKFQDYVEEDPEMRLRNCHPGRHPNCNCQYLCQRLLFQEPPQPLLRISKELGINHQTLNSHWRNRCLRLIRQIINDLGYSRDENYEH